MPDVAFAVAVPSGGFAGRTHISSSCKPSEDTSTTSGACDVVAVVVVIGDVCASVNKTSTTIVGASDDVTLLSAIVELAVGVLSTSESLSTTLLRRGVGSCVEVDTIDFALVLLVSACSASVDVGGDVR